MRVPGTGEGGLQSECEGVASRECRVVFGLFAPSGICMAKRGRPKGAKEPEASKKRKAERKARKEAELRGRSGTFGEGGCECFHASGSPKRGPFSWMQVGAPAQ